MENDTQVSNNVLKKYDIFNYSSHINFIYKFYDIDVNEKI